MQLSYYYRVYPQGMKQLRDDTDAKFYRAAGRTRDRTKRKIASLPRVDTGAMQQRVEVAKEGTYRYRITTAVFYAAYQEFGTSAHGPRNARLLTWKPRGKPRVFATWVRGVTPGQFMKYAFDKLSLSDFK